MPLAILNYSLPKTYRQRLEALYSNELDYCFLQQLRELSIFKMIVRLLKTQTRVVLLPLVDNESEALLMVLFCLTFFTRAREIHVVYPDFTIKKYPKYRAFFSFFELFYASLASLFFFFKVKRSLRKLIKKSPGFYSFSSDRGMLYLNANIWFGLKAGGSVGHIAGVVNAFQRNNFLVSYVSALDSTSIISEVSLFKLKPLSSFGVPFEPNLYRFNNSIVEQILKWARGKSFRFIYQRLSMGNHSGVEISRALKIPLVLEYNGSEVAIAKLWGKNLKYAGQAELSEEVSLKHASVIVTISSVLRDELIVRGIDPKRIVCYPNCIDPAIFDPKSFLIEDVLSVRQQYSIFEKALLFTFVGTFGRWHGTEILAEAIKYLVDNDSVFLNQHNIHFMLVGDGVMMKEVKELIGGEKYGSYVTFTGLIDQGATPLYLAASDVLLSPHKPNSDGSRFFGSPTKLFEYMAMGKAIIASDLEQIGEVLKNSIHVDSLSASLSKTEVQDNGYLSILCKPGDAREIVEAIKYLGYNSNVLNVFGALAREEVLKKYTWSKHVEKILEKCDELS